MKRPLRILTAATLMLGAATLMTPAALAQSAYADDGGPYAYGMMGMGGGGMGMHRGMMGSGMMGMGGGMMGMGPGEMGMMGMGPFMMLDLTGDQQDRINKVHDGLRKQHWEIMGKIMDEQARLRDLYNADTLNKKQISDTYGRIFKERQRMIETHVDAVNQINQVLTPEQRAQLRDLRRGRTPAGRGPMGPGMMR